MKAGLTFLNAVGTAAGMQEKRQVERYDKMNRIKRGKLRRIR